VGDALFQEKSMDRIKRYVQMGTTTIMVSHSMPIVKSQCDRVIWIDRGEISFRGAPEEAIAHYTGSPGQQEAAPV
jgi:ABC-type polysaccharide/polyol phosphate transport system ATPase subunit